MDGLNPFYRRRVTYHFTRPIVCALTSVLFLFGCKTTDKHATSASAGQQSEAGSKKIRQVSDRTEQEQNLLRQWAQATNQMQLQAWQGRVQTLKGRDDQMANQNQSMLSTLSSKVEAAKEHVEALQSLGDDQWRQAHQAAQSAFNEVRNYYWDVAPELWSAEEQRAPVAD
jgi:predicted  nucleic acid-binding Zn-ribbon protein